MDFPFPVFKIFPSREPEAMPTIPEKTTPRPTLILPKTSSQGMPILMPGLAEDPVVPGEYNTEFFVLSADFADTGERDVFIASSRMGKSYLMGGLLEQYLEQQGIACILDPQGEWFTLADRYPVVVAGGDVAARRMAVLADDSINERERKLRLKQLDNRIVLPYKESQYQFEKGMSDEQKETLTKAMQDDKKETEGKVDVLIQAMLHKRFTTVFDLSNSVLEDDQRAIAVMIIRALRRHNLTKRQKVKLVVEEAHKLAPESSRCASALALIGVAKEGAKEGIDLTIATQTCASISKEVLKQGNRFWFGGVREGNDLDAMQSFFGKRSTVQADDLQKLPARHFYYKTDGTIIKFVPGPRKCKHGGATAQFKPGATTASKDDISAILEALR